MRAFLAEADAAFAAGDADRFAAAFDSDARLFLLHNPEPIAACPGQCSAELLKLDSLDAHSVPASVSRRQPCRQPVTMLLAIF